MSEFRKIVTEIIESCPPGELSSVVGDLMVILGGAEEGRGVVRDVVGEYNRSHHVRSDNGVIMSEYNHLGGDRYVDYQDGKVYEIDPLTHVGTSLGESEGVSGIPVPGWLNDYVRDNFPGDHSIAIYPYDEDCRVVLIVSDKFNGSNYWNGQWRSEYIYDVAHEKIIRGDVTVDVHYYEDGNVRLQSGQRYPLSHGGDAPLASLMQFEDSFNEELVRRIDSLNNEQFKSLRRRLPVTRSVMKWGKSVGTYRLGRAASTAQ